MKNTVQYELKMFSSNLESSPTIELEGMNIIIGLKGYDEDNRYHECRIRFNSVIGYQYSLAGFTITLDSYDKIMELGNSEWMVKFKNANEEEFAYWKPRHYTLYLDEIGLYQFLAQNFEVEER